MKSVQTGTCLTTLTWQPGLLQKWQARFVASGKGHPEPVDQLPLCSDSRARRIKEVQDLTSLCSAIPSQAVMLLSHAIKRSSHTTCRCGNQKQ